MRNGRKTKTQISIAQFLLNMNLPMIIALHKMCQHRKTSSPRAIKLHQTQRIQLPRYSTVLNIAIAYHVLNIRWKTSTMMEQPHLIKWISSNKYLLLTQITVKLQLNVSSFYSDLPTSSITSVLDKLIAKLGATSKVMYKSREKNNPVTTQLIIRLSHPFLKLRQILRTVIHEAKDRGKKLLQGGMSSMPLNRKGPEALTRRHTWKT